MYILVTFKLGDGGRLFKGQWKWNTLANDMLGTTNKGVFVLFFPSTLENVKGHNSTVLSNTWGMYDTI